MQPPSKNNKHDARESKEMLLNNREQYKRADVVEVTIGSFGKWQLEVYILMTVVNIPNNWVELGVELFAHETDFWCKSPNYCKDDENCVLSKNDTKQQASRYT
ncbi:hypothetical protein FQA39_LY17124 [Lamprigera yunnana]|nr:hypothetical protein FQA39_LY17124 [Lamprigera yunnana]